MSGINSYGAEIAKQLKRIADALTQTDPNAGFADGKVRLTEPRSGHYVNRREDVEFIQNVVRSVNAGQIWDHQGEGDHLLHDDGREGEDVD